MKLLKLIPLKPVTKLGVFLKDQLIIVNEGKENSIVYFIYKDQLKRSGKELNFNLVPELTLDEKEFESTVSVYEDYVLLQGSRLYIIDTREKEVLGEYNYAVGAPYAVPSIAWVDRDCVVFCDYDCTLQCGFMLTECKWTTEEDTGGSVVTVVDNRYIYIAGETGVLVVAEKNEGQKNVVKIPERWAEKIASCSKFVAVGAGDKVFLYDISDRENPVLVKTFSVYQKSNWLSLSPDCRKLAVADLGYLRIFDTETGEEVVRIKQEGVPTFVAWSEDDLVAVGIEDGPVKVYQYTGEKTIQDKSLLKPVQLPESVKFNVTGFAVSEDGKLLTTYYGQYVYLYDAKTRVEKEVRSSRFIRTFLPTYCCGRFAYGYHYIDEYGAPEGPKYVEVLNKDGTSISSFPVSFDYVYALALGRNGVLACDEQSCSYYDFSGNKKWSLELEKSQEVVQHPILARRRFIVAINDTSQNKNRIIAIDEETGSTENLLAFENEIKKIAYSQEVGLVVRTKKGLYRFVERGSHFFLAVSKKLPTGSNVAIVDKYIAVDTLHSIKILNERGEPEDALHFEDNVKYMASAGKYLGVLDVGSVLFLFSSSS